MGYWEGMCVYNVCVCVCSKFRLYLVAIKLKLSRDLKINVWTTIFMKLVIRVINIYVYFIGKYLNNLWYYESLLQSMYKHPINRYFK